MTRFKFLPIRKQYSNQTPHNVHSKSNTQSSLPHYSPVTTYPNDYTLTTSPVDCEMDTPVRIYSKTDYSFPPPSFNTDHYDFPLLQHSWPLFYLTPSLSTLFSQKLLSLQKFNQSSKYLT